LIEDLKTLFDYSYWGNDKLCVVLSQLTTEQFTQPGGRQLRVDPQHNGPHAERRVGWLERCGGVARGPALGAQDYPTVTSLFDRWHYVEGCVREFLSPCCCGCSATFAERHRSVLRATRSEPAPAP